MNPDFLLEVAVGIGPVDTDCCTFYAGFFPGRGLCDGGLVFQAFAKAQIHAEQDFCPILTLGSTGAGMDGKEGVVDVIFTVEICLQLGLFNELTELGDLVAEFVLQVRVFVKEFKVGFNVAYALIQLFGDVNKG